MAVATRTPPRCIRGGLVGDKRNERGGDYHQHNMYCRQRLMMLNNNADIEINRVTHARNSECSKRR